MHWEQKKSSGIANILENDLFMEAASLEEYINRKTLVQRLKTKVRMLAANKRCQVDNTISCTSNTLSSSESLHSWSNGSLSGHAFQKVLHPCNNVTDYGAAYNRHDLSKCNDLNVLSEFSAASVGESNLETNSKSFEASNHFLECLYEVTQPPTKRRKVNSETECKVDQITNPVSESNTWIKHDLRNDTFGQPLEQEPILYEEKMQDRSTSKQYESNAREEVIQPKYEEKGMKSIHPTADTVSSTAEFLTRNRIEEHIISLRKQDDNNGTTDGESYKCQLCSMARLYFGPEPIYCICCGTIIRHNACYYYRREEEDTHNCICTTCYRKARGGNITFNGTTVSKTDLCKTKNDRECEEAWVQCSKCKNWQHHVCALYNNRKDLDNSAEYICLLCCLNENRNDVRVPFDAKDFPRTMLSDHIERWLLKRLSQIERNKIPEGFVADNLSVRVVLSVDKHIEVKKQFLDIFEGDNYPAEFSYASKVILLFQKIDGVDVCLFAMYAQEFGSECGYPNQRSIYISYLDSVKYFRPEIHISAAESLRTFVYHEILIGYLDFCKKRGFTTCYIWSCPPTKGEDYIFYCHPESQKTPKKDQLRHWYHSALRKAVEQDIVVGVSNLYDYFFVPTGKRESKVTAARLPYFDGDFWSGAAMDKASEIEQHTGGNREKIMKLIPSRSLKWMGCVNLSKGTAKDILVMQKLGQTISPFKEDFMVVQLQYVCIHCHKVIECGKRWFCKECKIFQECERCHTFDSHISVKAEKHKLYEVLMEGILRDTPKEKDIIINNNGLFDTRYNFLSFCQRNRFQFDSLRRAKYSSMMILHFLSNSTTMTDGISFTQRLSSVSGNTLSFSESPSITSEKLNGKNYLSRSAAIEMWFLGLGIYDHLERDGSHVPSEKAY
ncbi:probable histone acetyltransferase HAC-like 1 [Vigna radiata var. radiata]|uniref:histone acetyltransferase n=1 Tax=Vigna radiata var. radiata TaxID=3916 RepID=A0A3Q0EJ73_VIGRR|nr:probable histone acetyltransferase HAC-like 1 [Vigna radiata var. radiata]